MELLRLKVLSRFFEGGKQRGVENIFHWTQVVGTHICAHVRIGGYSSGNVANVPGGRVAGMEGLLIKDSRE